MNILSMLPFIPVFAIIWVRASDNKMDWITYSLIGLFLVGAVFGLWWQNRRSTRFTCPECDKLLVDNHVDVAPGDELNFNCKDCEIEWVTGLTQSTGD